MKAAALVRDVVAQHTATQRQGRRLHKLGKRLSFVPSTYKDALRVGAVRRKPLLVLLDAGYSEDPYQSLVQLLHTASKEHPELWQCVRREFLCYVESKRHPDADRILADSPHLASGVHTPCLCVLVWDNGVDEVTDLLASTSGKLGERLAACLDKFGAWRREVENRDARVELFQEQHTPMSTPRGWNLSLIHISEPTRLLSISYAVFCLKKKKIKQIQR
eukprot:TRINITY_DN16292_c0_g1_i1.p1 TRINITY_DN16292_c0_g1~~TRINITY_DN16292_c0_g1_i1.p1  ORF type:complete len:219 (+),score=49.90 TRINITY_DN16292_c0_g1_i1:214-870(+)